MHSTAILIRMLEIDCFSSEALAQCQQLALLMASATATANLVTAGLKAADSAPMSADMHLASAVAEYSKLCSEADLRSMSLKHQLELQYYTKLVELSSPRSKRYC